MDKISCGGFNIDNTTLVEEDGVLRVKSGGGGGGNSDWNASEGEPGYILNRPFYEAEEDVSQELFNGETQVYEAGDNIGVFAINLSSASPMYPGDSGNTFSVTIDGETQIFDDNTPMYDFYGTPIPRSGDFGLTLYSDAERGGAYVALFDHPGIAVGDVFQIEIEWIKKTVVAKKLDEKFLPSTIAHGTATLEDDTGFHTAYVTVSESLSDVLDGKYQCLELAIKFGQDSTVSTFYYLPLVLLPKGEAIEASVEFCCSYASPGETSWRWTAIRVVVSSGGANLRFGSYNAALPSGS